MKISETQWNIINTLRCERMSLDENNLRLVTSFSNSRNPAIVEPLLNDANEEDIQNVAAYYVVKNSDDKIVFYFSLKSGQLVDSFFDANAYNVLKEFEQNLNTIEKEPETTQEVLKVIRDVKEQLRIKKGISKEHFDKLPKNGKPFEMQLESMFNNSRVPYVFHTFSGIELGHFCKNEVFSEWWNDLKLPHSLGEVVFWHFIVPIIEETIKYIGSQYLFLFAADNSTDQSLVSYYRSRYGFSIPGDELSSAQSYYNLDCVFMKTDICSLKERKDQFFAQFNSTIV